jgi:hypothetical protein
MKEDNDEWYHRTTARGVTPSAGRST